ncbi:UDP-forming cellulose synthase catalytic subunit [Methylicorpusculum sp.]|uniref:UDP-forming cellulose synthase catalytic subunit n=1 Tax=Methylicorpusculum sp. TaxID=2713644 RepID=UPI00271B8A25|nr:UDP-forming cellulose synthase catalytic subunit [Methylicorpusculum sp.]MDO8845187.1 UDP-forming cellulose synthase catalytic subunit [Methylicorpusculum sp.]
MKLILMLLMGGGLFFLASLRVDWYAQALISLFFLLILILLRRFKSEDFGRVLFVTISSFIVLRYFLWRINYTLSYQDFFSSIGATALFLAELYGGLMFFLSVFVNIRPFQRTFVPLPEDEAKWPSVDVIIPTYNEPVDLVKITLAAATNIEYPKHKLNIYLLDDGATEQKLSSSDEDTRYVAEERKRHFLNLCSLLNVTYLNRKENFHAKAGNMNSALAHIHGDLILVLDADHAPSVDILTKTVGSFIADEKVFLVQTPHFFINPDPIEKNLDLFNRMPSENFMFYQAIQLGLDFWQSSFFCGSAAVLRRKAIDEIGGFRGVTITEDSETALILHSKGWKSHYVMYPLISGLQPETFTSFMIQRTRWAQGMVQNFIFHNPLLLPNLKIGQRIGYLSNMLFWFFPFARFVFLISPGLYLFFGLKIYNANFFDFLSYTVPYLVALLLTNHYLFSKVRWVFISEIYETMQSLFSIRAVWSVLKNPSHPEFLVTPKMETLEEDFISPLAQPFYWTIWITLLTVCFGIGRLFIYPEEQSLITITLFWAIFNLLLLLSALGALFEQKQRRLNPRIPVHIKANWLIRSSNNFLEKRIPILVNDLSMGGSSFFCESELPENTETINTYIEISDDLGQTVEIYKAAITNSYKRTNGIIFGIKFLYADLDEFVRIVRFVHGDSFRWIKIQELAGNDPGLLKSMVFMTKIGIYYGLSHIKWVLSSTNRKIKRYEVKI